MIDYLIHLDKVIFFFINGQLSNPVFDAVLPWIRNKVIWIPLYILIAYFLIYKYKIKGLIAIMFLIVVAGVCDFTSSSIVKPFFERLRPCNNPEINGKINLLVGCGGGFSFTSSHATNHFGLAIALILLFYHRWKWILPAGIVWAGSISLAQVYVGVHYPVDIFFGAFLGTLIAILLFFIYKRIVKKCNLGLI
jgi:membrane-associated phospholipid phosphatase